MKLIRIACAAAAGLSVLLLSGCVVAPAGPYGAYPGYYQAPVVVSPSVGFYGSYGRGYGYGGRGHYWRR